MAFKIKRRGKPSVGITKEELRVVVNEELSNLEDSRSKKADEERKKQQRIKMLNALSPHKRLKLLRYLKEKGERHGEK